ncbi:MAG: hypothetical protein PHQ00_05655 [Phycisphaerae bacterium]|nr:hypothetical protein [Phycisphaerae bacterium]
MPAVINIAVNLIRLAVARIKETKTYNINCVFGLNGAVTDKYNNITIENNSLYSMRVWGRASINIRPVNTLSINDADSLFIIRIIENINRQCANRQKEDEISHVLNSQ